MRWLLIKREDIRLNDAQLDRCMRDPYFSMRYDCIRRPEFQPDQARFEVLLQDSNPNMLRELTGSGSGKAHDLQTFAWATLRNGSAASRVALGRQTALTLDSAQIDFGSQASEPEVVAAFKEALRRSGQKR